jgi:electron transport complex protein RnfC
MSGFLKNDKSLTFRHGIHPKDYKELSNQRRVERMPFVDTYILPLSQHIGAPSVPLVKKGDTVKRGQMIAEPGGYVSVALHAPVDGKVTDIGLYDHPNGEMQPAIKIEADPFSAQQVQQPLPPPVEEMDTQAFIEAVQHAGIVGMGGAAFPAHVKFSIPEGKNCQHLMLNGCECEPFLTCDHRLMAEFPDEVIDGARILNRFVKAEKIHIGIEHNKPDAIDILQQHTANSGLPIEVVALQTKYPQGAEKMMISAILGEEVPSGAFPLEVGTLMSNVGTVAALSHYFRKGHPFIERIVTVTGTAIQRPANVLVPLGTSIRELLEFCGGITDDAARILLGGPMMGVVQKNLDAPIVKGISGILVLTEKEVRPLDTYSCIRCGRCLEACPLFLNPARLGLMAKKGLWEEMEENHVMDCFECASCSFVCPSSIPLVQSFRVAKGMIREMKAREKASE